MRSDWSKTRGGSGGITSVAQEREEARETHNQRATRALRKATDEPKGRLVGVTYNNDNEAGTYTANIASSGPEPIEYVGQPEKDHPFINALQRLGLKSGEDYWVQYPEAKKRNPLVVMNAKAIEEAVPDMKPRVRTPSF